MGSRYLGGGGGGWGTGGRGGCRCCVGGRGLRAGRAVAGASMVWVCVVGGVGSGNHTLAWLRGSTTNHKGQRNTNQKNNAKKKHKKKSKDQYKRNPQDTSKKTQPTSRSQYVEQKTRKPQMKKTAKSRKNSKN